MIHAREDYNRIQDPENKIGEDEPVFLIRAKDVVAPEVVLIWGVLNQMVGGDPELTTKAYDWGMKMKEWQEKNGCQPATGPTPSDQSSPDTDGPDE